MLSINDKHDYEIKLISTLLADNEIFFEAMAGGFSHEIFSHNYAKIIAKGLTDYYEQKKEAPDSVGVYQFMFMTNGVKDQDLKDFFWKNFSDARYYLKNPIEVIILLHEHTSVMKFEQLAKSIQSSKLQGMDFLIHAQEKLSEIIYSHYGRFTGQVSNLEIAEELMADIRAGRKGDYSEYIPFGYKYLDRKIIGVHKKSVTIIAGRPSMGKTAFMQQLARNWKSAGYKVGIFSMEMDRKRLMIRDLSEISGVDSLKIQRSQDLTDGEFETLRQNISKVADEMYVVDDSPYQTAETITTKAHHWKVTGKADIILIDYIGLVNTAKKNGYDKKTVTELIGEITTKLRIFAKETSTPVIAFAQLNRKVEERPDKRPILSDLRDSGNIEQDANTVLLIYRPDYYFVKPPEELKFQPASDWSREKPRYLSTNRFTLEGDAVDFREYFEVIVAKQRDGNVGTVPLRYIKQLHRFETLELKHAEDPVTNRILSETADPF